MRNPATLAVFCLGAITVCGFGTCGMCRRRAPRVRSRYRDSTPGTPSRAWSSWTASASDRSLLDRRPSASGAGKSDDYGADYSEYGYEPEYEMQDEESISDEETLARLRQQKLLVNDRWQFGIYGKQNTGYWLGRWQEYIAQRMLVGDEDEEDEEDEEAMIGLVPRHTFSANTRITRRVVDPATEMNVFEHEQEQAGGPYEGGPYHPPPLFQTLFADSFRGENGTQVVGNTYTMGATRGATPDAGADGDLGEVWVEVGLRARDVRVRCIFQYGRGGKGARLERVFLAREGLERLPVEDSSAEVELYGAAGKGLYDPPKLSRSPLYMSLYAQGGLTVRFPLRVEAGDPGVFSVDWTAGEIRYQADRTFDVLDGSCRRLEVTEIGTADAEIYLPEEKF